MSIEVTIVTPERRLLDQMVCREVELPGAQGMLGVLEGHAALMTPLSIGLVHLIDIDGGEDMYIAISGGFAQIGPERVQITARSAELEGDIDVMRAEAAHQRAMQRLKNRQSVDPDRAEMALARAVNRIRLARKKVNI